MHTLDQVISDLETVVMFIVKYSCRHVDFKVEDRHSEVEIWQVFHELFF